jgi:hypothetical protein
METLKFALGIAVMAVCGAFIALIGSLLFDANYVVILLIVWLLEYGLFNEFAIRKIEHMRDERYEAVRTFLQGFEKKEVVKALEAATITFQTAVVKHKEFLLLFGENRTVTEQTAIDTAEREMLVAKQKYLLIRSMVATFRSDLPWREDEAYNTFLPKSWKPKRYA